MAETDARNARLFDLIDGALAAVESLPPNIREGSPNGISRVESVLAYARVVIERTDFDATPSNTEPNLTQSLTNLTRNAQAAVQAPETHVDPILALLNTLPVSHGREVEQAVRDAAANFQRAAAQRLRAIEDSATSSEQALDSRRAAIAEVLATLEKDLDTAEGRLTQEVETLSTGVEQKVTELESTLTTLRQSFDETLTRHSEAFSEAQGERTSEFDEALAKAEARLTEFEKKASQEVEQRVAEIRRMEQESAALVGAIGLEGTAERYGVEAVAQKKVADWLRGLTIVLALGAVVMAAYAVIHNPEDAHATAAKLGVSLVFGALAAYTARQSGRHRTREERARNLQLELTAFAPFIEPLDEPQRELERVLMTRKTFGRIAALPEADDPHSYGPLGPVVKRLEKTDVSEE